MRVQRVVLNLTPGIAAHHGRLDVAGADGVDADVGARVRNGIGSCDANDACVFYLMSADHQSWSD